eukprot:g2799.t1
MNEDATPNSDAPDTSELDGNISHGELAALFESDSDGEPAVSSVGSAKSVQQALDTRSDHLILPTTLEPPEITYSDDNSILPVEFEVGEPISLQFPIAPVHHESSNVIFMAPGEWISIADDSFDEEKSNGFIEGAQYNKRVVRWRQEVETGEIESNSRLIEWDDGSFSLFIEGKCFDLGKESFCHGTELLCLDQQNCLQALHAVGSGMYTMAMPSDDSDTEGGELQSPVHVVRKPKTKRVTVLSNPVKDREEKLKKIEEERRDREMIERKQKYISEKYSLPVFDHMDDDEEEDEKEPERLQQPRTRPSRRQPARSKKRRPDEFEDDFIADDNEGSAEGLELGEDFEEEIEEVEEEDENEEQEEEEEEGEESENEEHSQSDHEQPKQDSDDEEQLQQRSSYHAQKKRKHTDDDDVSTKPARRSVVLIQDDDSEDSDD